MSRSQLLKDLVSSTTSIENILLRLKIILSDLDNETIMNWVNGELEGYKEKENLPNYRILTGSPMGTFIVNRKFKYTDAQVPLESLLPNDLVGEIKTLHVHDGIATVQTILNGDNRDKYAKQIPTSFCHSISRDGLQIAGMNVMIPSNQLEGIVSHVKSKLVNIIMELERQFENLDDLDIRPQLGNDTSKKAQMIYNIEKIIYEGSIEMGDKNKIKNSKLGNFFGGK